jgi:hypothetical protein
VAQHSSFCSQVLDVCLRVLRHTSHLNAISSHALRSVSSSTLITGSRILSHSYRKDCGIRETYFALDVAPEIKMRRREVGGLWRDRIRDAVTSVDKDMLRTVWHETAFRWDMCCITIGSRIEYLRTKAWMLGYCCGAISFPICDLNKKFFFNLWTQCI